MNLILHLTPEIEAKLRQQAAATGQALEDIALQAIEEQLVESEQPVSQVAAEQWVANLRAWAASHSPLPIEADDSRESIYSGRGE